MIKQNFGSTVTKLYYIKWYFICFLMASFPLLIRGAAHNALYKIVPFKRDMRHIALIVQCAIEHFPHLFTGPAVLENYARAEIGLKQAMYFTTILKKGSAIDATKTITSKVKVLEINHTPVGYIQYTYPYPLPQFGHIDQLAILAQYQKNDYGSVLLNHALHDLKKCPNIKQAQLITTSEDVGKKFYEKKHNFTHKGITFSASDPDQILHIWEKPLKLETENPNPQPF